MERGDACLTNAVFGIYVVDLARTSRAEKPL